MHDDGDQLIVEKNSESIEMGRHRALLHFSLRRPSGPAVLRSSVAESQVKVGPKAHVRTAVADSLSVPLAALVPLASASPSGSISDLADRLSIHDLRLLMDPAVLVRSPQSLLSTLHSVRCVGALESAAGLLTATG